MTPPEIETLDSVKNKYEVKYNKQRIDIPRYDIKDLVINKLENRVTQLEEKLEMESKKKQKIVLPNAIAEIVIGAYILEQKKHGIKLLDVIDISESTNLPFNQIKNIIEKFKKRGLKEV